MVYFRSDDVKYWHPIPVVMVDDEEPNLVTFEGEMKRNFKGRQYSCFGSLDEAYEGGLLESDRPFGLILDHDLGQDTSGTAIFGHTLSSRLRQTHRWGLALPIVYFSGRMLPEGDQGWLKFNFENGLLSPNFYAQKGPNTQIPDLVGALDAAFERSLPIFLEMGTRVQLEDWDSEQWRAIASDFSGENESGDSDLS